MKIQILVSSDKYFGDTANANIGRLTASARPPFRASGPGYEKTTIWIEFKYHSTPKASYRIKRVLIHILSGYVLELIATGIFYEFLNIYKILRILREQNIVKFQRSKITSDTWFQTEKDIPHQKAISQLSKYAFKTLGNKWNEFLGTQSARSI